MKFDICGFCTIVCMISLLGLAFFFFFPYPKMLRTNHPLDSSSDICLCSVVCNGIKKKIQFSENTGINFPLHFSLSYVAFLLLLLLVKQSHLLCTAAQSRFLKLHFHDVLLCSVPLPSVLPVGRQRKRPDQIPVSNSGKTASSAVYFHRRPQSQAASP